MADDRNLRHRFTVPVADTVVNEWIEKQSNLGFSIRTLINAFVKAYGIQDATCLEFGAAVKKRGRPPKQVQIQYDNMMADADVSDDIASDPSFITADPSSDAVMGMFKQTAVQEQKAPVVKPAAAPVSKPEEDASVKSDEEGFVDPESLFG